MEVWDCGDVSIQPKKQQNDTSKPINGLFGLESGLKMAGSGSTKFCGELWKVWAASDWSEAVDLVDVQVS